MHMKQLLCQLCNSHCPDLQSQRQCHDWLSHVTSFSQSESITSEEKSYSILKFRYEIGSCQYDQS